MSYLLGWGLIAAIAAILFLALRKVGAPGGADFKGPTGPSCCSAPPQQKAAKGRGVATTARQ